MGVPNNLLPKYLLIDLVYSTNLTCKYFNHYLPKLENQQGLLDLLGHLLHGVHLQLVQCLQEPIVYPQYWKLLQLGKRQN